MLEEKKLISTCIRKTQTKHNAKDVLKPKKVKGIMMNNETADMQYDNKYNKRGSVM